MQIGMAVDFQIESAGERELTGEEALQAATDWLTQAMESGQRDGLIVGLRSLSVNVER